MLYIAILKLTDDIISSEVYDLFFFLDLIGYWTVDYSQD